MRYVFENYRIICANFCFENDVGTYKHCLGDA